jgi:carboxypeptidase PM20D1
MTGASDSRFLDRVCDQCIRFLPFKIDRQQLASIHGLDENVDMDSLSPAVDYYKFLMREV